MKTNEKIRLIFILMVTVGILGTSCSQTNTTSQYPNNTPVNVAPDPPLTTDLRDNMTPGQVLQAFKAGNERFVSGNLRVRNFTTEISGTAQGQNPYAIVLSCIDSRVPSETVFDKRIGDMFNHRVAGNIINEDVLGGMEFATNFAGAKLIMVMGHTKCGAVQGAVAGVEYGNLTSLLDKIEPVVEAAKPAFSGEAVAKNYVFVNHVAAKNVDHVISEIRENSPELAQMEQDGKIMIVGTMYEVETGKVIFYE